MRSSDPKQITVLSLVAIGAVGYLGFTLFGGGSKVIGQMAASTERQEESGGTPVLSGELLREPFSHPKLAGSLKLQSQLQKKADKESQATPPKDPAPDALPGALAGAAGYAPVQPKVESNEKPAENAGPDRKSIEVKGPHLALTAIVKVERPMAFLSVNGGETRAFREGVLIAPGLRLISITEGSVKLRTPLKTVELRIGQEIDV